ncbi:hypothetical protein [Bradyrhizobium sp. F1.13.3]|uniref:spike base protein, RCAP_Rcc01079 family n=1 Tax=Bradyrhizobium sp. F1.13.3 TaxID=3156351 RepID=UPI00339A26D1
MSKTAIDPFFGTNNEPISAPRKGAVVTPSDSADLPFVTSKLIVTLGAGGTGIVVIFANGSDQQPVTIPLTAGQTYILEMQVRRVLATGTVLGTSGGVVALWS